MVWSLFSHSIGGRNAATCKVTSKWAVSNKAAAMWEVANTAYFTSIKSLIMECENTCESNTNLGTLSALSMKKITGECESWSHQSSIQRSLLVRVLITWSILPKFVIQFRGRVILRAVVPILSKQPASWLSSKLFDTGCWFWWDVEITNPPATEEKINHAEV